MRNIDLASTDDLVLLLRETFTVDEHDAVSDSERRREKRLGLINLLLHVALGIEERAFFPGTRYSGPSPHRIAATKALWRFAEIGFGATGELRGYIISQLLMAKRTPETIERVRQIALNPTGVGFGIGRDDSARLRQAIVIALASDWGPTQAQSLTVLAELDVEIRRTAIGIPSQVAVADLIESILPAPKPVG